MEKEGKTLWGLKVALVILVGACGICLAAHALSHHAHRTLVGALVDERALGTELPWAPQTSHVDEDALAQADPRVQDAVALLAGTDGFELIGYSPDGVVGFTVQQPHEECVELVRKHLRALGWSDAEEQGQGRGRIHAMTHVGNGGTADELIVFVAGVDVGGDCTLVLEFTTVTD